MLIPIDHGNSAIKTVHENFPTGMISQSVDFSMAGDVLEYDGQIFSLVKERNIPYMYDKTADDTFFYLSLFAIGKELVFNQVSSGLVTVDLAVGLPPEHYRALMDKFRQYFLRDYVNFIYNKVAYSICIRNVFVYPQAYAALMIDPDTYFAKDSLFFVDIGGYTTDLLHMVSGDIDMTYCRSLDMGTITMSNEIAAKVNSLYNIPLRDSHIHSVLNNGDNILKQDVKDIILNDVKHYARFTIDKLRELRVDLRSEPVVFLGGGANMLRPYLKLDERIAQAFYIEDPKANAIGYEKLALQDLLDQAV